ncbi:delta-aminolevulinic acid dehydratase/porphobilinogen synthase [Pseudomonas sp. W3I7]|nr:delta-aminolevulinic acid dehydratase/porphobilinogen synthase [Pseudomonas sp. W3I7]
MHGAHVDNDATQVNLGKQAVTVHFVADVIAPSATMDGQIQATRRCLDGAGFTGI